MLATQAPGPDLELRDAHESIRLGPYLRDLWSRRSYIWYVSTSELRSRQVTNVFGNFWHLLNPILSIGVYYVIFGLLLDVGDRSSGDFFLFLTVGLFIFQFTQKATTDGAKSIINNVGLIKAIKFPRAMLPITSTVTETIAFLPSSMIADPQSLSFQQKSNDIQRKDAMKSWEINGKLPGAASGRE